MAKAAFGKHSYPSLAAPLNRVCYGVFPNRDFAPPIVDCVDLSGPSMLGPCSTRPQTKATSKLGPCECKV